MFGMTENSKRQFGLSVWPIDEKEIGEIQPFIVALQQDGWEVDIDYKVDYTRNDVYSKPWRYRLECSKKNDCELLLDVFKRPHSKGFFKSKFIYSIEIGEQTESGIRILGYIADTDHENSIIQAFSAYQDKDNYFDDEFKAIMSTNPDVEFLAAR